MWERRTCSYITISVISNETDYNLLISCDTVMDWMCPPPPKFICWTSIPQGDGIRRWCLWEIIRMRWGHEVGILMNGIKAIIRITKELASSLLLAMCEYNERFKKKKNEGSHQNPTRWAPWSRTSREICLSISKFLSINVYISIVHKFHNLFYCCNIFILFISPWFIYQSPCGSSLYQPELRQMPIPKNVFYSYSNWDPLKNHTFRGLLYLLNLS